MIAFRPTGPTPEHVFGVARRLRRAIAPTGLLPVLALAAAGATSARYLTESGAGPPSLALTLIVAAALAPLALLRETQRLTAGAALLAGLALVGLPHFGVLRFAVLLPLVLVTVAWAAARELAPEAGAPTATAAVAVVLAAQLATRGERLWLAPGAAATWLDLLALPLVAGLALARAGASGPAAATRAAALALALFAAAGGWHPGAVAGLVVLAGVERLPGLGERGRLALAGGVAAPLLLWLGGPPWFALALLAATILAAVPGGGAPRAARALLLALALLAAAAAALPWRRSQPALSALQALAAPRRATFARPIAAQPVVLTAESPRFEAPLVGGAAAGWTIDSYLVRGTALACGQPLVHVRFDETEAGTLVVGRDSAEWAAERSDVAASLACPAPPPWSSWFPAAGRFLGHHYRGRGRLDPAQSARRIVLERDPALPPETAVALFHLAVER